MVGRAREGQHAIIGDVFGRLSDAWQRGRPIVPLFGAGISACAGIPFGPRIVEYLIGVRLLCELSGWRGRCSDYVQARGWPDANELSAELSARCGSGLPRELARVRAQLGPDGSQPASSQHAAPLASASNWWWLIHHITGSRNDLIEAFFDGLVRNRRPGSAHQFIAYLAKLIGWRLILTTNFDDLIETALRDDGSHPVVYELVRGGTLPNQVLVRRHLSVIKLHGGAFGLRTGFDLHRPMDRRSRRMFTACVPRDALVLVVGQGGREERVLSLVRALLQEPANNRRDVLWLHYEEEPPSALSRLPPERVHAQRYGDASSFFHELYQRLTYCHPVGRGTYRAIHPLPERLRLPSEPSLGEAGGEGLCWEQVCVQWERAKAAPAVRLWFNLYQFTSVAAFVSALLEELHRNDRTLPPLFLSPIVAFGDLERAYHSAAVESSRRHEVRQRAGRRFRRHIAYALRRQRYFIALDAVNGFANPQSKLNVQMEDRESDAVAQRLRLEFYAFMRGLGECDLGESEVYVSPEASDPLDEPIRKTTIRPVEAQRSAVRFVTPPRDQPPASTPHSRFSATGQLEWVAISFRKPRSLAALVRLTAQQMEERGGRPAPGDAPLSEPQAERAAERAKRHRGIQANLDALVSQGLLERQDGGSYSMNGRRRDELFAAFARDEPTAAMRLQYAIAMDYRANVYEQSRDVSAYLEYVFHRLACIDTVPKSGGWHRLFGSLERERAHVLGRGEAASLLDALSVVQRRLDSDAHVSRDDRRRFSERLQEMRLEIRRSVTDIEHCVCAHLNAARSRMLPAESFRPIEPCGWADSLRAVEACADDFRRFDAAGSSLGELFQSIEQVLSIAEALERLFVVRQESNAPRLLAERAAHLLSTLPEQCFEDARGAEAIRHSWLEVRCCECLMDIALRQTNPWAPASDLKRRLTERRGEFERWFERARDRLVEFGQREQGVHEHFVRLRCLLARHAYLSDEFGRAAQALNIAHAFAERASGSGGAPLAVYHIHRAEYCILFFRAASSGGMPAPPSLIDEALTELAQAEAEFGGGRRDVFWMVRSFMLRARAHLERTRLAVELCLRAPPSDATCQVELERAAAGVLGALYGSWINNYENPQRADMIDEVWNDLERLLQRLHAARRPTHPFEPDWAQLNASAGLDDYHRQRRGGDDLDGELEEAGPMSARG